MLDRSNRVIGHITIVDDKPMDADSRAIGLVKISASRAAAELKRQKAEDGLQAALEEVQRLKELLYRENVALRDEVFGFCAIILAEGNAYSAYAPVSCSCVAPYASSPALTRKLLLRLLRRCRIARNLERGVSVRWGFRTNAIDARSVRSFLSPVRDTREGRHPQKLAGSGLRMSQAREYPQPHRRRSLRRAALRRQVP